MTWPMLAGWERSFVLWHLWRIDAMPFVKPRPTSVSRKPSPLSSSQEQERGPAFKPDPRWSARQLRVNVNLKGGRGLEPHDVEGEVLGLVGVYQNLVRRERTGVTALAVGLQVLSVGSLLDAKRIAEMLWRECAEALRQPTKDKMLYAFRKGHPWVETWVQACHEAGGWLDPKPFGAAPGVIGGKA